MFGDVAREPIVCALHGFGDFVLVDRIDGLIERHVDICANFPLCLHGYLWVHTDFVAVDVGFKSDAVVVDFCIRE